MTDKASDVLAEFFSVQRTLQFAQGETILQAQAVADGIYYLQEGVVNLVATSPKGEEVVVNVFKPGSFFPVQAVLNKEEWKSGFSFVAAEDITVQKAPSAETKALLLSHPEIVWDLLTRIYRGMDGLFLRMAQLMGGSARSRVIQELIIRARRFGTYNEAGVWVVPVAEKELAALAGVTRETVSRIFSDLKKKKLANYSRQEITIFDLEELEKEV